MEATFNSDEKLLRVVSPVEIFWKDGKTTSACFKDKKGLSVNRTWCDKSVEAIEQLESVFPSSSRKAIISIKYAQCIELNILVKYLPLPDNVFHSELHRDNNSPMLSQSQCKGLSRLCVIEKEYA